MKVKSLISLALVTCASLSSCEKALDRSYKKAMDEAGEEKAAEAGTHSWHSSWINADEGQKFHSELSLNPGQIVNLEIHSDLGQEIGFVVEKGYEISKEKAWIYMGTEEKPHELGASVGSSQRFDPDKGVIRLRFENSSSISTKVAVYTQTK